MTATFSDSDVVDVTSSDFATQVLAESERRLVMVDFWAAWCGPCQQLMPLLHRVVDQYAGRVRLAKVDSDAEQELAARYGVRSLPTVMFFRHGEVVDQFMGVQPEATLHQRIEAHLDRPSDGPRQTARERLASGDAEGALAALDEALSLDPDLDAIRIERAEAWLAAGNPESALAELAPLPLAASETDAVKQLRTRAEFARSAQGVDPAALEAAAHGADAAPEDIERLARFYVASDRAEEALPLYLTLMQRHRAHNENAGHKGLLSAFEILGSRHPAVSEYRRKMVALLY